MPVRIRKLEEPSRLEFHGRVIDFTGENRTADVDEGLAAQLLGADGVRGLVKEGTVKGIVFTPVSPGRVRVVDPNAVPVTAEAKAGAPVEEKEPAGEEAAADLSAPEAPASDKASPQRGQRKAFR